MALLQLSNLQLSYRLNDQMLGVLDRVDLKIDRGEMIAILGPSGSGKSTLLYILGCLLKPTSGSFKFLDREVTLMSGDQLADLRSHSIGFVFQQFHLLPRASVLENVLLAAKYSAREGDGRTPAEIEARAFDLIEHVGLTEHIHHTPNQLSGGQQQRVAIARALLNNPQLILADEPTGNLDSKSSGQVLDMLQKVNASGHTVILITHDPTVAARCARTVRISDGRLQDSKEEYGNSLVAAAPAPSVAGFRRSSFSLRAIAGNLLRHKGRSILTMLGVTIGIAAVLSTVTLGSYAREKILEGYEVMGSNKLIVRASPRWRMRATDVTKMKFEGVDQVHDIQPIRRLFPEIELLSPVVQDWIGTVEFGGRSLDQVSALGVTPEYFAITNRQPILGRIFNRFHVENHSRVCVIGYDIGKKLFGRDSPIHQVLQINGSNNKQYSCQVIGVLASQTSNNEWNKPNTQVLMPDSFLSLMASRWNSKPYEFNMRIARTASAEDLGKKIQRFFRLKYGKSVSVNVDADQILVSQMGKFLNIFAMLLAGVGFISLAVGGIGITNMMLVSVTERIKEIGLRKALGARDLEIFVQLLVEAVLLCSVAGAIGIIGGIGGYHGILYLSAKLFPQVQFEWVFSLSAILISTSCILLVGVASGVLPALRARRLEVVEALRNE